MEFTLGELRVEVVRGDITQLEADVIVNAANSWLKHGGGVALAIVRRGGDIIQRESDTYVATHGPVPVGGVAVTGAGALKARYVVHAVGPVYGEESHAEKLASAFRNALLKAEELGAKSIALPAISTGVYGYPLNACAEILAGVLAEFAKGEHTLKHVTVCLRDEEAYRVFTQVFQARLKA